MKSFVLVFFIILALLFPHSVSAHLAGQPPFFKINGIYTPLYPVPSSSLEDFVLPQDIGIENYLVGEQLNFEIDAAVLPVLSEIVNQTKFTWDYGDGTKAEGLKNTHTYKKMGSHILTIHAQYLSEQPQLIQSVLLNIVPSKDYQLPKSIIKINGQKAKDPLLDIIKLEFGRVVAFDGSESTSQSKIVSYFWDLGDTNSKEGAVVSHTYSRSLTQVFPLLRIKNEDGFIADSFIQVNNEGTGNDVINKFKDISENRSDPRSEIIIKTIVGIVILIILYGGFFLLKKRRMKKRD